VIALFVVLFEIMITHAADFVVVIDTSGSMQTPVHAKGGRSRVAVVQEALRNYLSALPLESRVTIVAFNDRFQEQESILHAESDRRALLDWIRTFEAEVKLNRGTRLYDALRRALTVAQIYAHQNPNQYVQLYCFTDGLDSSGVPADRAIPEILKDFPEVDGSSIQPNLVLAGDWSSALIARLERELRTLGLAVIDASDLGQPILPPVIVQSPDPAEIGQDTLFADNSPTPFAGYEWLIDGRPVASGKSLRQRFDGVASHRLTLVGITVGGRKLRAEKLIQVSPHELAVSYAFFPVAPEPGEEVRFIGRAIGTPVRWDWSLNGRVCGQDQDVKITFPNAGSYEVAVNVTDKAGTNAKATKQVQVVVCPFTVQIKAPAQVKANDEVQFASEVVGKAQFFKWEFNDGAGSSDRNPMHRFAVAEMGASNKVFDVRLTVVGIGGRTATAVHRITVVAPPREQPPTAGFRLVGSGWKTGDRVQIVDDSQGAVSTHYYEFCGEGVSTNRSPTFAFIKAGLRVIRQRVTGPGGDAWATNTIVIQARYQAPVITASVSPQHGLAPLHVKLSAQITGDYRTVRWMKGNQVVSTNQQAVLDLNEAQNVRLNCEVTPADPLQATVTRDFTVSVARPTPLWAKIGFPCAAVAFGIGVVIWRRLPRPLIGELQWECRGKTGRGKLSGRSFDLRQLEIAGWHPKRAYVLRNLGYTKLFVDGTEERPLSHKTRFSFDGANFAYLNEAL
jgi:PKD repeat protein